MPSWSDSTPLRGVRSYTICRGEIFGGENDSNIATTLVN